MASKADSLSRRQRHVAELLASGLSAKEIGYQLDLAEGTIRYYINSHTYRKLGVKSQLEFLRYWITHVEMVNVRCCTECIAKMV